MTMLLNALVVFGRNLLDGSVTSTVLFVILIELALLAIDIIVLLLVVLIKYLRNGKQDQGYFVSRAISPADVKLDEILLDTTAVRRHFKVGDEFSSSGLMVTALYSDGSELEISSYTVEPPSMDVAGETVATVRYEDAVAVYTVFIEEKEEKPRRVMVGIETDLAAVRTSFIAGEEFTYNGLIVNARYNLEPFSEQVEDFTVSAPDISAPGSYDVAVTYGDYTTTYAINVAEARKQTGITLDTSSVRTSFIAGEQFVSDGLIVYADYNVQPFSERITDFTVNAPELNEVGSYEVTVSSGEFTASYLITVEARTLIGITLDTSYVRTEFIAGERFTSDGLIVNGEYNAQPFTEQLIDYSVNAPELNEPGSYDIVVSHGDFTATYFISVAEGRKQIGITLDTSNVRTQFTAGEIFNYDGLIVNAEFNAEPYSEQITSFTVETPDTSVEGIKEVKVTSGFFTATYAISVFALVDDGDGGFLRYDRSFTARLIQSDDEVKNWYNEIKNELLSYKKVKDRMSWKRETYKCGRDKVAILGFRGKSLCLFLALDPTSYEDSKYKVENVGDNSSYAETPCMYRIKNDRRAKYAIQLIEIMMEEKGIPKTDRVSEDYYLPYEGLLELINKGLIRRNFTGTEEIVFRKEGEVQEAAATTEAPVNTLVVEEESVEAGILRYDRSFEARLIQSEDEVKNWYSEIKNELLSYKKVKERMSWKKETYRFGKDKVAKIGFRGKSLCLFLALEPSELDEKYKVESFSSDDTPCMYRIKNDKRAKYARQLIEMMMEKLGAVRYDRTPEDYYMPYEGILELIEKGLIKRDIKSSEDEALFHTQQPTEKTAQPAEQPTEQVEQPAEQSVEQVEPTEQVEQPVEQVEQPVEQTTEQQEDWSFKALLSVASDEDKEHYSTLKNDVLSYDGVESEMRWESEAFMAYGIALVKFAFVGDKFCVHLALDPKVYDGVGYPTENVSHEHGFEDTPLRYAVQRDRDTRIVSDLIADLMHKFGLSSYLRLEENYFEPHKTKEELISSGLIKLTDK